MMNKIGKKILKNLCTCTSLNVKILKYKGLHGP